MPQRVKGMTRVENGKIVPVYKVSVEHPDKSVELGQHYTIESKRQFKRRRAPMERFE